MILVTGGAGFIGSHLCDRLLADGQEVVCLDNFNDYYDPRLKEQNIGQATRHPNFVLQRGDILDCAFLEDIFSSYRIDRIVHLAALAGVRPSLASPAKYIDIDIKGTVNLLEAARKHNVGCFIFGSSSSVYGASENIPFSENDLTERQVSPYAAAKKAGELYCWTYHHLYRIPVTVLRFFTVYGPRQRPEMAIHKFTRLMLQGESVPIFGDGLSERDYTFIDDCVDGLMAAIQMPFEFEILNIGNSTTIKLVALVELIARKIDVRPTIERLPDQPGDVPRTWADITKARSLLGYSPRVSIDEGIDRFAQWYSEHRYR